MDAPSLTVITAFLSAAGAFIGVYYSSRAVKAKIVADRGERELAGVKVSVDSLQAALIRSDAENAQLRRDIDELRVECREERRISNQRITDLSIKIRSLGGEP